MSANAGSILIIVSLSVANLVKLRLWVSEAKNETKKTTQYEHLKQQQVK